ncbi:MAG: RNA 2',3'-cyclic phosphodiesterase [Dehalococcoidales bacterium]|nr:RNA 2',3'-cyclic phosphodiesterase [Dehalococcoidales bacterium]
MEKIRSFIAVELPVELKQALSRLQAKMKSASAAPVKWVEPGNIHLTLKFLGDVSTEIIGRITAVLEDAARGTHPFDIGVSGLGAFPALKRARVIWVGLTGELEKLEQLQKRIEAGLEPLGFPPEGRPFSPHLTIGRVRDYARPDDRLALGELIGGTILEQEYKIGVNAVHLIKSQLTREGPIYSKISAVTLK